jgi:hypothetical protein
MNGPKRVPFKNLQELKRQYRTDFVTWFLIGAGITYPFAILVGRRMMMYQGGVPVVPNQRWIEDWPNVRANRTTNRFFRRYAVGTCFIGGFVLA